MRQVSPGLRFGIGPAEQRLIGGAEVGGGQAVWVQLPDLFGYGDGDLDVLAAEERKFRELISRGRSLLRRLYPSGRLTEEDYEFLRDTHGLPREVITELLREPAEG